MAIKKIGVRCCKIPTPASERDGTLEWDETKLVIVELSNGNGAGVGYTYADNSTAVFICEHLAPLLKGQEEAENIRLMEKLKKKIRNLGNGGISSMALSAVDIALWDLKAKKNNLSIQDLLGARRESAAFYGSGLFINNSPKELENQINEFKNLSGTGVFKMKIGENVCSDIQRVKKVREIVGDNAPLYVDANGRYEVKEALGLAMELERLGVVWFEEPITSDDVQGLKYLRKRFPKTMKLVAGEYCYQIHDFLRLLENQAVDLIQVDATRCEGVTGALRAASLAKAFNIPVSTHTAPALHGSLGVCLEKFAVGELFFDHMRIEEKYFDKKGSWKDGRFYPSKEQKGFGWSVKENATEAQIYEQIVE